MKESLGLKGTTMTTTQSAKQVLSQIFGGSWITQGLNVAAELGIADLLAEGPRTAEQLARQTHSNAGALYRVLRALASVDIFAEDEEHRFSLTPLADSLRSDVPESQRAFAIMMGAEFHDAWGGLLETVQTGEQGFQKRFGVPFFQYMTEHPERHAIYDAAMAAFGVTETEPMLDAYDFSDVRTVVDIGGGNGQLLGAILERYPAIKGVLFDLPAVADRARVSISGSPLSDRCTVVGGDFFSCIPAGCDAYILRHIVHDWEDNEAVAILSNCRKAMDPSGRVLVVEDVIPPGNGPFFGKWLDLMMLLVGGRERTAEQYRHLFSRAGLRLNRVVPTVGEISVVEGVSAT